MTLSQGTPHPMLIDSHCHLTHEDLSPCADALMVRAAEAGVGRVLMVGCDIEDSAEAVAMARRFARQGAWASIGIHPHEARRWAEIPQELSDLASDERVVALGEMGLDYHYDHSPRDVQQDVFVMQLDQAARIGRPVVLHVREAMEDAMAILRDFRGRAHLLFHCYSGGLAWLDEVLDMGALCAIGGAVTWKGNDELRDVARSIPIDRLLLETDCPYMAPVPFRGKPNEPSYVRHVYEAVAKMRGVELDELAVQIQRNADAFFGWGEA